MYYFSTREKKNKNLLGYCVFIPFRSQTTNVLLFHLMKVNYFLLQLWSCYYVESNMDK